jgi:hypothetical protein
MRQSCRGNNCLERERVHRSIWARELPLRVPLVHLRVGVVVSVGGRPLAVACRAVESGATTVRHGLCSVLERVYIVVPRFAVGLENSRVVLSLPAAAALDVRAVAVGGSGAALPAVQAEGQALSVAMNSTDATEAGQPADALLADIGARGEFELTLRHGLYLCRGNL